MEPVLTNAPAPTLAGGGATDSAARALEEAVAGVDSGPHQVFLDCDPALRLGPDVLAALRLVVGEAIENAIAHAFPCGGEGRIWVRLAPEERRLRLTIRDSGIGIADAPSWASGGAQTIRSVGETLGGYARLGSAPFGGGLVSVVFPQPTS